MTDTNSTTQTATIIGNRAQAIRDCMLASLDTLQLKGELDQAKESVSDQLLAIGVQFQTKSAALLANPKDSLDYKETLEDVLGGEVARFTHACKVEESFIKSIEAGDNQVEKVPAAWTNAKSVIKRSMEAGYRLNEYTVSMLKQLLANAKVDTPLSIAQAEFKATIKTLDTVEAIAIVKLANQLALTSKANTTTVTIMSVQAALDTLIPVTPINPEMLASVATH